MFAWTRTFYALGENGIYYNFDMKRQRDDAVKNHGLKKVPAVEAYKHYRKIVQVPWETYAEWLHGYELVLSMYNHVQPCTTMYKGG